MKIPSESEKYNEVLSQVQPNAIHDRLRPMTLDEVVLYVWNASRLQAMWEAKTKSENWLRDLKKIN